MSPCAHTGTGHGPGTMASGGLAAAPVPSTGNTIRAPLVSQHLVTTGRNARVVKAAQETAQRFGEEMVKEALQMANLFMSE
ncbi:hypothetical protein [Acidithiobacillus sp.]|uniref:hypothetical protein n=1 Tax=Acidithiobacillus sp. TaxID=1872118 RepID=UPI0025C675A6|nr:hypothetical protein [Acidithiobacillus sp.]MCK9188597.1 hypothetical protein [Acidithiobacillus sp.]MCK9360513.1 hypothetical protein [Acidithiobacillus sp.]